MSGYERSRSAKRSRVKTTEPFVEFSKGTTPLETAPDCTASKISVLYKFLFVYVRRLGYYLESSQQVHDRIALQENIQALPVD
jgi:hypothetical protein